MNVLRMIKLFGWEAKTDKRISEKREVELIWTWKTKILELVNNNLKRVFRISSRGKQRSLTYAQLHNSPLYHDGLLFDIRMIHDISTKLISYPTF
jgi:hypothetical protein